MQNFTISPEMLKRSESHDIYLDIDQIMRDYCTQIDKFVATIFLLSALYIIIEIWLIPMLEEFVMNEKIGNLHFTSDEILRFTEKMRESSRYVFLLLNVAGFTLYVMQVGFSMAIINKFILGFFILLMILGFIMQYKQRQRYG